MEFKFHYYPKVPLQHIPELIDILEKEIPEIKLMVIYSGSNLVSYVYRYYLDISISISSDSHNSVALVTSLIGEVTAEFKMLLPLRYPGNL